MSFDANNVVFEVYVVMAFLYLVMLAVTIASIRGRFASPNDRTRWLMTVLLLPIVGMALYCIHCLRHADYEFLRSVGLLRNSSRDLGG